MISPIYQGKYLLQNNKIFIYCNRYNVFTFCRLEDKIQLHREFLRKHEYLCVIKFNSNFRVNSKDFSYEVKQFVELYHSKVTDRWLKKKGP